MHIKIKEVFSVFINNCWLGTHTLSWGLAWCQSYKQTKVVGCVCVFVCAVQIFCTPCTQMLPPFYFLLLHFTSNLFSPINFKVDVFETVAVKEK